MEFSTFINSTNWKQCSNSNTQFEFEKPGDWMTMFHEIISQIENDGKCPDQSSIELNKIE